MSRISNIIRGLFGRKPVHQQNKSTASQMGRTTAPKSEKMIQKMPVKTMRKEESDVGNIWYIHVMTTESYPG